MWGLHNNLVVKWTVSRLLYANPLWSFCYNIAIDRVMWSGFREHTQSRRKE